MEFKPRVEKLLAAQKAARPSFLTDAVVCLLKEMKKSEIPFITCL